VMQHMQTNKPSVQVAVIGWRLMHTYIVIRYRISMQ